MIPGIRFAMAGLMLCALQVSASNIDTITFGAPDSEAAHDFSTEQSDVITGGLGEPARELLPQSPFTFNGGSVGFHLAVNPTCQNYLTVKLWGSDKGAGRGRLILYLAGQQVGYRHEGDHDVLNQCDDEAVFQGRFLYQTVALPPRLTEGKTNVSLRIAGLGEMYSYGTTFSQYQKLFITPSRGIYRAYTHTNTFFEPDAAEKQGAYLAPQIRPPGPGEEIITQMRSTVNQRLQNLMVATKARGDQRSAQADILFLAEAYNTPWTTAYHNPKAIKALVRTGDLFLRPNVIGNSWVAAGPLGEAVLRVGIAPLERHLREEIEVPTNFPFVPDWHRREPLEEPSIKAAEAAPEKIRMTRREAWAKVLHASVDWNRKNGRRFYTNQSMIADRNIYTANRGLRLLDESEALPEAQAMRYLYEAVGLRPWLGNDLDDGGSSEPYGTNYMEITRKGLSRELGYVGTYGETILKFMRDIAELTGDENIRKQLIRVETARVNFRYPSLDADGFQQMKLVSEIDARTAHFPLSYGAYTIPDIREAWWMELPAFLKDPVSVGAAQQCLEENQYFPRLASRINDPDSLGMMRNVDEYAAVKELPKSNFRLPMTDGQPDYVFSDEQDAVVALKHGTERLFLNFYFRQEFGVSGVVRILDVGTNIMRIASVKSQVEVDSSGKTWTRPDIIDTERTGGLPPPGETIHQAWRGEKLPISRRPDDASRPKYGSWGPFVGKAAFYSLRYGDYLFGINTTTDETFELAVPQDQDKAQELVSRRELTLSGPLQVPPLSSVVLYFGK